MRKFLHFKSASIPPSSPYVSVLKNCVLGREDDDYEFQEMYEMNGYHQCSLFPADCPDLDEYEYIASDISSDLERLSLYLTNKTNDKPVLLFTNSVLLKRKIKVIKKMWNLLGDECGNYTNDQRLKWFKENARDRLSIEFYGFGDEDDISDAVLGILHLFERNNDKILQYFTVQRRVFDRDPVKECEIMQKYPKLKALASTLLKMIKSLPKKKSMKVNVDGNRVKVLAKIFDQMVAAGLDEIDDLYDDDKMCRMHKVINLQFMFYIESTFDYLSGIMEDFGHATKYQLHSEELKSVLQRGIDLFCWFYSHCKWIVTPTTFDTFISLPFCLMNLLRRNEVKNVKVCYKDLLDQETENNVKVIKDRFASNNQRKAGQCKSVMNSHNFATIAKLEQNMMIMKYDKQYDRERVTENTWFDGKYDLNRFDNFGKRTIASFRAKQFEKDPLIQELYENKRIRDLEKYIQEHENEQSVGGEYKSDDEEEQFLLNEFQRMEAGNKNKSRGKTRERNNRGRSRNNKRRGRGRGRGRARRPNLRIVD